MRFPVTTGKACAELVNDAIVFDTGNRVVTVAGPFAPQLFTSVLPLMSGNISVDDIIQAVSGRIEREVVEEFIDVLAENRLIHDSASELPPDARLSIESDVAHRILVSERTGLISSLRLVPKLPHEPRMPVFGQAVIANISGNKKTRAGVGKGTTENQALTSALAEALERCCALYPDRRQIVVARKSELDSLSIDPREFILYSTEQYASLGFPYLPFEEERLISWQKAIEVRDATTNRGPCFVPAQLVSLSLQSGAANDQLAPMTSNGLAAGPTLQAAILSGILELIERDCLLLNWVNLQSCDQVQVKCGVEGAIIAHYRENDVLIKIFHLKSDVSAYVMMAVAFSKDDRPPFTTVGLGCSLDPSEAARKSIFELCQVRHGEIWRGQSRGPAYQIRFPENVRLPEDHSGFYSAGQFSNAFEFLENGTLRPIEQLPSYSRGTLTGDFNNLIESLHRLGMRVFYIDLTLPELKEFAISVVRVLIAGLQPMHFGFGMERLGGQRLFCVPKLEQFARVGPRRVNTFPHPLG